MADERLTKIADLLHQVGEVHHIVFSDTDGNDDDWATFYSDWLLHHSALAQLLGKAPVRSHLTHDLVQLDADYTAAKPSEPWPTWYATRIIAKYA